MITKFDEHKKQQEPEIGDYVLCLDFSSSSIKLDSIINNNIGKIVRIEKKDDKFKILYERLIMQDIISIGFSGDVFITKDSLTSMFDDEITYWSKDKEELEIMLQINKYNI